ncbi:CRISPR-associated endonuclease Cas2 [Ruegeria sp.]|uniref:CRISPR-associated endonuclease Cas2 n=1 Tax=Ruegeria sp. TaxID=1879320 RepID=UPI003C7DE2D6
MTRFVVCYDIADDKRRQRVAQILDAYGDRIQGSVFELPVTAKLMQDCLDAIVDVLDIAKDGLIVYPLCAQCNEKTRYFGISLRDVRIGEENVFVV